MASDYVQLSGFGFVVYSAAYYASMQLLIFKKTIETST